jgi:hypothetical protein
MCRLFATHSLKNIALMGDVLTVPGHLLSKRRYHVPLRLGVKSPVEIFCSHAGDCEDCYLLGCDVMHSVRRALSVGLHDVISQRMVFSSYQLLTKSD